MIRLNAHGHNGVICFELFAGVEFEHQFSRVLVDVGWLHPGLGHDVYALGLYFVRSPCRQVLRQNLRKLNKITWAKIYMYKRPLDSYACPEPSNRNRTNQQIFLCAKNIKSWCHFMWKRTVCVQSLTFFAHKALFSTQFFWVKMLDYKGVSSVIFDADKCTYMCNGFHQI